jgi:hypothetical protein
VPDKEQPQLLRKPVHNAHVNLGVNGFAAFESSTIVNHKLAVKSQALCISSPLVTARSDCSRSRTKTCVESTIHTTFVNPSVNRFFEPEAFLDAHSQATSMKLDALSDSLHENHSTNAIVSDQKEKVASCAVHLGPGPP